MEGSMRKDEKLLPPGFRFHPTDEELVSYYLVNKISDASFTTRAVTDVDLNKCEPWDLPGKAKMGEKEWYFFSLRDRKYPTGIRTNRATNTGYWKTTGKDKEILDIVRSLELIGMKKTLVFYRGRAPRGEKTNWVMHEYRIHLKSAFRTPKDEWVVCRVFRKNANGKKYPSTHPTSTINNNNNNNPLYNPNHHPAPNFTQPPDQIMPQQPMIDHHALQFPNMHGIRNYTTSNAEMSYPHNIGGGGCFTISGLNLNLGHHQQDHHVNSTSMFNAGYGGGEMNNVGNGGNNNRFMANMDQCTNLDSFWPAYM